MVDLVDIAKNDTASPCPFCGARADVIESDEESCVEWIVECSDWVRTESPACLTVVRLTRSDVLRDWNALARGLELARAVQENAARG